MNQILVTEKLYVTPDLKRKKKFYKFSFILSFIFTIILMVFFIYSEYYRNKEDSVSNELLVSMDELDGNNEENDNVWKIIVASKENLEKENNLNLNEFSENKNETEVKELSKQYTAKNGKTYDMVGKITIPKINVNEVILKETTIELLKVSPCRFYGPENPNEVGNFCIAGHNYRNKRFFSKVPTLKVGDIIEITDLTGRTIKYSVDEKYTVNPEDTECLNQITNGKRVVTLITCTNDSKQRVIIHATEI